MNDGQEITTKNNVSRFDDDVRKTGSYAYTAERLSSRIANGRISKAIAQCYDFSGKSVLDLGCGDGTYTLEFPALGVRKVIGVDPAASAIDAANAKAEALGVADRVKFEVGNIYALESYLDGNRFDCIVLRGVLHHLPDPARAIAGLSSFGGAVVVLEPNGLNPVLKVLEKVSRYHVEHEERSFTPSLIRSWFIDAGFFVHSSQLINLVPMFCPDWMAKPLRLAGPLVEKIPFARAIACGQIVILAGR